MDHCSDENEQTINDEKENEEVDKDDGSDMSLEEEECYWEDEEWCDYIDWSPIVEQDDGETHSTKGQRRRHDEMTDLNQRQQKLKEPDSNEMKDRWAFRQNIQEQTDRHRRLFSHAVGRPILQILRDREVHGVLHSVVRPGIRPPIMASTQNMPLQQQLLLQQYSHHSHQGPPLQQQQQQQQQQSTASKNSTDQSSASSSAVPNPVVSSPFFPFGYHSNPRRLHTEFEFHAEQASVMNYRSSFLNHLGASDQVDVMGNRPQSSPAVSTISIAFAPNALTMASTHGDHSVKITSVNTGRLLETLEGHPRTPWTVKFHPTDSTIVASGCLGFQVRVWKWTENESRVHDHDNHVDYQHEQYHVHDSSQIRRRRKREKREGGHRFFTWGHQHYQQQQQQQQQNYKCLHMIRLDHSIISLSFHPSGQVLAIASGSRLHFWNYAGASKQQQQQQAGDNNNNISSGSERWIRRVEQGHMLRCVHFLPKGDSIIVGGMNRHPVAGGGGLTPTFYLRLWHFDLQAVLQPLQQHGSLSPTSSARVSSEEDNTASNNRLNSEGNVETNHDANRHQVVGNAPSIQRQDGQQSDEQDEATRKPLSRPRIIIPRVLLYNDGGFDVSPDGKTICACAEYWLPAGVDSAMELLVKEQEDYESGILMAEQEAAAAARAKMDFEEETEMTVTSPARRTNNSAAASALMSYISPPRHPLNGRTSSANRVGLMEPPPPPRPSTDHLHYSMILTGTTSPITPPTSNRTRVPLSPPSPPTRRRWNGNSNNSSSNAAGTRTPGQMATTSARHFPPPPPPPRPSSSSLASTVPLRPPHRLSTVAGTESVYAEMSRTPGRYVPHVVTVSLDTDPIVHVAANPLAQQTITRNNKNKQQPDYRHMSPSELSKMLFPSGASSTTPSLRPPTTALVALGHEPRLGQLIQACPLSVPKASAVTCVKFSPCANFCLLGYGIREPGQRSLYHPVTVLYRVRPPTATGMTHVSTLLSGDDDVNIARFHPHPGNGFVYGTKQGRVRLLNPRPWNYYNTGT